MLKLTFLSIIVILMTLSSTMSHADGRGSLQQCQYIQDKITYYTNLKRAGGSASQMNHWHKKRNHYKAKFADYNCKVYRNKLTL